MGYYYLRGRFNPAKWREDSFIDSIGEKWPLYTEFGGFLGQLINIRAIREAIFIIITEFDT